MKQQYEAMVEKVIANGKHGSYAVATHKKLGKITFSLDHKVWKEKETPDAGSLVILQSVRKKRAGWRAKQARFFTPEDQQTEKRKENSE